MKIKHQGLLLVFVPFSSTLLICASMLFAEAKAEAELARQAEFREVLSEANALPYHFMLMGSSLISWRMSKKTQYLSNSEIENEKIEDVVASLRRASLKSDDSDSLRKLADDAQKLLAEIKAYRINITDTARVPGSFNRHTFAAHMQASLNSMFSGINRLAARDNQQGTALRAQYEKLLNILYQLIILSLLISLATAILTAYLIGRRLNNKISAIEMNFTRFERGEQLLPPLAADDEVSALDQSFHAMTLEIARAEEEKRETRLKLSNRLKFPVDKLSQELSLMLSGVLLEPNDLGNARLRTAITNLEKLNELINELLNIDEGDNDLYINLTNCETREIIESAVQCLEALAAKENHHLINRATESFTLLADARKIEQVLINLLSNSCKYSEPSGPIEISCHREGPAVRISVKDKGKGLNAEQCLRVFEKFEQADNSTSEKGLGLGLPICKKIVEQHGGCIGVESKTDDGCLFWFELPVAQPRVAKSSD